MARLAPLLATRGPMLGMVGGAAGIALLAVVALSWWGSGYAVLYAGLSGEEGGRTLAELAKLNIPYKITEGGRVILVPSDDVGRARLQLAARGIPRGDGDEWAVLDNESLGVSPFVEQVHYVRGVESALSRTVRGIDGVISAKVSLAVPKETDFLGSSPKPSASVLLRLRPGTELTSAQIDGIVGLVASSVPGLARDSVTIVDQTGRQLSADGKSGLGQAPQQLELSRAITHRYEQTITDLLVPILGRGNFRVSADADVDFSQAKESLVTYGASHILSQDETTHTRTGDGEDSGGIPGALSNRKPDNPTTAPPPQPAQPAQDQDQNGTPAKPAPAPPPPPRSNDVHKTTNYDIDRTVQYLERPSWTLKAISVAVLVNNASGKPMPAEKMDAVKELVSSAIGAGQNPHITVVDLPFEDLTQAASVPGAPWYTESWVSGAEHNAMLALAGLLALFGGVLPLLKRVGAPGLRVAGAGGRGVGGGAGAARAAGPGGPGGPNQGPGPRIQGNLSEPAAKILAAAQDVFSIEAETVQTLVNNDPARTAQVIRGWIASDRNSLKQAS
ncbi:MAG TPA: flagellar basal-body MS-ring/collar protein FliF [Stellaceae bacterium]|jgi:flagellar M-ring protein FliF